LVAAIAVSYTGRVARVGLLVVVGLASLAGFLSLRERIADGGTPGWDSASHGLQGYAIAQDVARLDVANFVPDVFGHRYRYPPGHPLVLALAYGIFGPSWWTAIGVSVVLFGALAVLLYVTAESKVAGFVSALLALTCPALLALSGQIMLEIPAAILAALSLRLYARSLDDDRAVRPLGWTLTVFMVTAAQYAACMIVTLLAFEAWRSRAWLRESLVRFSKSRSLFHPLHLLIGLAVLVAIAIRVTGGWTIPIGSRTLSMTRAGGPLIAAALLAGVRVAWLCWKHRAELREVPKRYRDIFITAIVPIYVWVFVLYPPRFQQFAEWISRPPDVHERTQVRHWTYYPDFFVNEGHATGVAAIVVALVVASFLGKTERFRFYRWAVIAGALLVVGHHARQERFIAPFLVAWWILASETLVHLLTSSKVRLAATAAVCVGIVVSGLQLYRNELRTTVCPPPVHGQYESTLRHVIRDIGDAKSIRVIGGIDGLSRHLFEWELRKKVDVRKVRVRYNLDLPDDLSDPEGPRKVFDAWLAGSPEEVVVALEPRDLESRPARPVSEVAKSDHDWPEFSMRFLRDCDRYRFSKGMSAGMWPVGYRVYRLK
jgi:hypothetical protein